MLSEGLIFKISSNFCLKTIFSYLNYKDALNLVKYNKKIQYKLELNKKIYGPNYKVEKYKKINYDLDNIFIKIFNLLILFFEIIHFIYFYIFGSKFSEYEYDYYYYKLLFIIIFLTRFLNLISILYCITIVFKKLSNIPIILVINIIMFISNSLYFTSLIFLLKFVYKMDKNKKNLILIYIYIIIIFLVIISYILFSIFIFLEGISVETRIYIKKYKGISIKNFYFPESFEEYNEQYKWEFIFKNIKNFELNSSEKGHKLIDLINKFREENLIQKLLIKNTIPDIFINGNSEVEFLTFEKILKLKNNKYLFRYSIDEFSEEFNKSNKNIIKILLIDILNKITFITKNDIDYILIEEDTTFENNENINRDVQIYNYPRENTERINLDH